MGRLGSEVSGESKQKAHTIRKVLLQCGVCARSGWGKGSVDRCRIINRALLLNNGDASTKFTEQFSKFASFE